MARIDTSIKRPYFGRQNYGRVVDNNFNQLVQTSDSSTKKIQDLIKEYNRLYDSLPPDIHEYIARTCAKALGTNIEQENIDKINELNHILDDLENQLNQDDTIDLQEHPNFPNGSFIQGDIIVKEKGKLNNKRGYWFMQRGHRRPIGQNADDVDLFKFLFNIRAKKNPSNPNINQEVPLLDKNSIVGIPLAKPILRDEFGAETKFTNIFELPEGYIDAGNYFAEFNNQFNQNKQGNTSPENIAKANSYIELINALEIQLENNPNDGFLTQRIENLKAIFKNYPPQEE